MEDKKNIITFILCGLIIILLVIITYKIIDNKSKINDLESISIHEISDKYMLYMDNLDEESDSKYLNYAIDYATYELGKTEVCINEVVDIVNGIFNKNITRDDIIKLGIKPSTLDKNVVLDYEKEIYRITKSKKNQKDIANISLINYVIDSIKKGKNNTYIVKYSKLENSNPYDLLNKYTDEESITNISKYLKGEESVYSIKKYMNMDTSNKIGEVEVTYIVKDNKILIDTIK